MENSITIQPSKRLKFFFWIILGSLSVFFAEVVSGSDMFPFFHAWGLIVVFPLYTLHVLVLSYVVFNYGRPSFYTLFTAGTIFGMYEAYITKVLWSPTWGDPLISVAGVAAIELIVLVFFWHPFMSFIIPLFVGESILTGSRRSLNGLPGRIRDLFNSRRRIYGLLLLLAGFSGIFQSLNSPSPIHSLLSGLSTTAVIMFLIYLWRNKTKGGEYDIRAFLPNKREFLFLSILLAVMYITLGILIRPDALPGLFPQLIIWLVYAGLFIMLFSHLRKSRKMVLLESISSPINFSWKLIIVLPLLFTISSTIARFMLWDFRGIIMLLFWFVECTTGISVFFLAIKELIPSKGNMGKPKTMG